MKNLIKMALCLLFIGFGQQSFAAAKRAPLTATGNAQEAAKKAADVKRTAADDHAVFVATNKTPPAIAPQPAAAPAAARPLSPVSEGNESLSATTQPKTDAEHKILGANTALVAAEDARKKAEATADPIHGPGVDADAKRSDAAKKSSSFIKLEEALPMIHLSISYLEKATQHPPLRLLKAVSTLATPIAWGYNRYKTDQQRAKETEGDTTPVVARKRDALWAGFKALGATIVTNHLMNHIQKPLARALTCIGLGLVALEVPKKANLSLPKKLGRRLAIGLPLGVFAAQIYKKMVS